MADYGVHQSAGNILPLAQPSANTLLQDADSVLYYALDYWSAMIINFDGARLLAAATAAGLTWASAVNSRFPYDPGPYLTEMQVPLQAGPALFAFRKQSQYKLITASWEHTKSTFGVLYVLPPMTASQSEQLYPVLHAVEETLRITTTQGYDPSYTPPGGSAGQSPWSAAFANAEEVGMVRSSYGWLPGAGNLYFPCLTLEAFATERDMQPPAGIAGRVAFAGGDISENLTSPDGTSIANVVQVSTQQAPTVSSLSVTSGTQGGGTSMNITGTLFLTGPPIVLFGANKAPTVTWNSATSLTVTTPAASGGGAVPVIVINRDGQVGSLSSAYTYTTP